MLVISLSALVSDFSVSGLADTSFISFSVLLAENEFSAAFTENRAQIDPLFEYLSVDWTPQAGFGCSLEHVWIKKEYKRNIREDHAEQG